MRNGERKQSEREETGPPTLVPSLVKGVASPGDLELRRHVLAGGIQHVHCLAYVLFKLLVLLVQPLQQPTLVLFPEKINGKKKEPGACCSQARIKKDHTNTHTHTRSKVHNAW